LWQEEREISWRGSGYWCWIWVWRWGKNEFVEGEGVSVEVEGESSAKGVSEDEFDEDKEYVASNDKTSDDYAEDESDFCNALSNYLIILLDDMVYVYILYDFDDYVTYLW